jgi:glycosyltransferase involved in cell wall biosynthesis
VKILIITYFYAPDLNPRAFRWTAIASRLARAGHRVDVLCAGSPQADGKPRADGPVIHRVRDWLLNASLRYSPERDSIAHAPPGPGRRVRAAARSLARFVWRATRWPDYACGWLVPAARRARAMAMENDYDWIISVSHPYTGHIAGLLARPAKTRWLVDIGDPFHLMEEPAPNNRRLFRALNRGSEGRVLAQADAISVTTEETKRLYLEHFPVAADKLSVIGPLLSLPEPAPPAARTDGVLKLVYCGTLYRKLRSPRRLLELFAALMRAAPRRALELHFYGLLHDCAEMIAPYLETPSSGVRTHGLVGREQLGSAMADADVLISIGNASPAQLPSKVIEYMAIGKPVLNLPTVERDASTAELAGYPLALTIGPRDATAAPETADRVLAFLERAGPADPALVAQVRRRYSEEHVTGLYLSLMSGK